MMHRSYSIAWAVLTVLAVGLEGVALVRRNPGDTLSEHVWAIMYGPAGAIIYPLLSWLLLWHFPWGRDRALGWQDGVTVLAGLLFWLVIRAHGRA